MSGFGNYLNSNIVDNVWSGLRFSAIGDGSLKYSHSSALGSLGHSLNWRIRLDDTSLVYRNTRYKSVLIHIGKQTIMSSLSNALNQLFPKYRRYLENKVREDSLKEQEKNVVQIIKDRVCINADYGSIKTSEGHTIYATDAYGNVIPDALMLYYEADAAVEVQILVGERKQGEVKNGKGNVYGEQDVIAEADVTTVTTKTVCHIDLCPRVSVQSVKNLVMTQVTGRDFTRKELVSGGDLTFTVNGEINSNKDGVYPENAVRKFEQLMLHNGILNVHSRWFKVHNVTKVIIKDWGLSEPEFKNIQPYTFTCVAVEPDDAVIIKKDSIGELNKAISESPQAGLLKITLGKKLDELLYNQGAGLTSQIAGMGLDALVPNI